VIYSLGYTLRRTWAAWKCQPDYPLIPGKLCGPAGAVAVITGCSTCADMRPGRRPLRRRSVRAFCAAPALSIGQARHGYWLLGSCRKPSGTGIERGDTPSGASRRPAQAPQRWESAVEVSALAISSDGDPLRKSKYAGAVVIGLAVSSPRYVRRDGERGGNRAVDLDRVGLFVLVQKCGREPDAQGVRSLTHHARQDPRRHRRPTTSRIAVHVHEVLIRVQALAVLGQEPVDTLQPIPPATPSDARTEPAPSPHPTPWPDNSPTSRFRWWIWRLLSGAS
jgi:hypothetical protein